MAYCENCGGECLPGPHPSTNTRDGWERVKTIPFCDDRCKQEWLRAQNVASLETYRRGTFNGA